MNVTFDVFDANPAAMLFALVLTIRVLSMCRHEGRKKNDSASVRFPINVSP